MPAVRDKTENYLATTSNYLSMSMCDYAEGDLLLLHVVGDTGAPTQTVTSTGSWTKLYTLNNTISTNLWYKIASGTETDIVVSSSVLETYNAVLMSIRDVDTTNPFGNPAVYTSGTQTFTTRFAMQTITTNRDDCLALYFAGNSANTPGIHIVENKAHELSVLDGAAEGQGVSWLFQKASGTTPSNIYCCSQVTSAGTRATVQICPPTGGATVIPPYCVSDDGQYLDPNTSTTAFDGNTAMANTADTVFGTTLNGFTVGDATVAAAADIGVNSYHAMLGLTNVATGSRAYGARVVLASSRYGNSGSNILAHFRHPTPANNQRLSTLKSGRGVWMGLKSGATNLQDFAVWQVHASDVPIIAGNIQPIIIHPGNTDYIQLSGTISNTDIRTVGFWTGGVAALTQQTCIGPMWRMGTTTIAGGTSAEPIGIPEIIKVAATDKERVSSLLQGTDQMLCLQAVRFGDGGSNPIYLELDATAVEFPSQKNVAKKAINYNGVDNAIGFTYYPGASDTIIHKSSIMSSANRYHWIIHPSSSNSASYNFNGLNLIGAGDVQLKRGWTFDGITFASCSTIPSTGSTITNCLFTQGTDALSVSSSADMNLISNVQFEGNVRGIKLTASGTHTFTNVTFTGNTFDIHNASGGNVIVNAQGTSNPSTSTSSLGGTVTINNTKTLTFSGIISGSEVRVYTSGTTTELSGSETVDVSTSYTYNYAPATNITYVIFALGYLPVFQSYLLLNADATLPIQQIVDRQFFNPP